MDSSLSQEVLPGIPLNVRPVDLQTKKYIEKYDFLYVLIPSSGNKANWALVDSNLLSISSLHFLHRPVPQDSSQTHALS